MTNEAKPQFGSTIREIGFVITLLLNLSGLVWGVAKMDGAIEELRGSVSSLTNATVALTNKMNLIEVNYEARLRVLEDRVEALRQGDR